MSQEHPSNGTLGPRWRWFGPRLLPVLLLALALAACGSHSGGQRGSPSPSGTSGSSGRPQREPYQRLAAFFAAESGTSPAVDPMTFIATPGSPAAVGPLSISHVAGIAPAEVTARPDTPLLGAAGTSLGITLRQWKRAKGTVAVDCVDSSRRATSTLTGLLPGARYSIFAVHTAFDGPRRFSPWGDAAGTTNNFRASPTGTA